MNPLPSENAAASETGAEIAALKNQIFTLLVALIVVSGTLTVYLYRQVSLANKDITQSRQVGEIVAKKDAAVTAFVNELAAYGQKHPDFAASVLKKYGIPPTGIPATPPVAPNK